MNENCHHLTNGIGHLTPLNPRDEDYKDSKQRYGQVQQDFGGNVLTKFPANEIIFLGFISLTVATKKK